MSPTNFKLLFLILGVTFPTQALPNPHKRSHLSRSLLPELSSRPEAEYSANNNEPNRSRRGLFSRNDNPSVFDMRPEGMRLDRAPVPPRNSRIYHGALSHLMTFMVSLQYEYDETWNHFCGATIITKYALLTAAHCFGPETQQLTFRAVYGTDVLSSEPTLDCVHFLFGSVHFDSYNPEQEDYHHLYDNAVVVLSEDIRLGDNVSVICLAGQEFDRIPYYFTFGWGRDVCYFPSNLLRYAQGWLIKRKECEEKWLDPGGATIKIQEGQMCAIHAANAQGESVSIDKGDSGGPIAATIYDAGGTAVALGQFGIASFLFNMGEHDDGTLRCPNPAIPQVFSKISYHIDFIHKWAPDLELCPHP